MRHGVGGHFLGPEVSVTIFLPTPLPTRVPAGSRRLAIATTWTLSSFPNTTASCSGGEEVSRGLTHESPHSEPQPGSGWPSRTMAPDPTSLPLITWSGWTVMWPNIRTVSDCRTRAPPGPPGKLSSGKSAFIETDSSAPTLLGCWHRWVSLGVPSTVP